MSYSTQKPLFHCADVRWYLYSSLLVRQPFVQTASMRRPSESDLDEGQHLQQSSDLAFAWREATRWAFTEALAAGYLVTGFTRVKREAQCLGAYQLSPSKKLGDFVG